MPAEILLKLDLQNPSYVSIYVLSVILSTLGSRRLSIQADVLNALRGSTTDKNMAGLACLLFLEVRLMQIGNVFIENPLVLAPMAGVTGQAFRKLCKEQGAGLVVTEMVSAKALTYNSKNTKKLLAIRPEERPISVQLFGSEPDIIAEAAKICVSEVAPDIIDINMGCPAPKIVKNEDGSALLKEPKKAIEVAKRVVETVEVPVTCKIRLGWDEKSLIHKELAKGLEDIGVSSITVHGRVRQQFYSGKANWQAIAEVVDSVSIPVIGNGDVFEAKDALRMEKETGASGVAIGRGALGNPWIFRDILAIKGGEEILPVTLKEKLKTAFLHAKLLLDYLDERTAMLEMRKHMAWYLKGERKAKMYKQELNSVNTLVDLENIISKILLDVNS